MKYLVASIAVLSLFFNGCQEKAPTITPCQTDRVVLVEEFTGVNCSGCPLGAQKLKEIAALHGTKIIIVGIHAGDFAGDLNGFNLNTPDGALLDRPYIGPPTGYPSATINRYLAKGESSLLTDRTKWAGIINTELCKRPIVDLDIVSTFDATTNQVSIVVNVVPEEFYLSTVEEDVALTILITEDDIIGDQLTPNGVDPNYVHNHVLRDILSTNYSGDVLYSKGTGMEATQQMISNYSIPSDWNPNNCHVVAFVHYKGDNKTILQATESKLK